MGSKKNSKKVIVPLPYSVYFLIVVFFALAGFSDSLYLSLSHYRVYTDMAYKSFCAVSRAINCDTVSQSRYSVFLGIPVPVWGAVGYAFFIILLPLARGLKKAKERIWTILFLLSIFFSIISIVLALVSTIYIHSYCIMCVISYAINFFLLYFTWLTRKRFQIRGIFSQVSEDLRLVIRRKKYSLFVFVPFFLAVAVLFISMPAYWEISMPKLTMDMPRGITKQGSPWIGAENPKFVIEEFTDYQCFQCKKMHFFLRRLVAQNKEKIRLVHHHFPMDQAFNPLVKDSFHGGAGKMALLAIYAAQRGKFWVMNDLLFDLANTRDTIKIKDIADKTGLDARGLALSIKDPRLKYLLEKDINQGIKLGITGTPGFLIMGKTYLGKIPSFILKKILPNDF